MLNVYVRSPSEVRPEDRKDMHPLSPSLIKTEAFSDHQWTVYHRGLRPSPPSESIKNAFKTVADETGRIDVLVNDAAYVSSGGKRPEEIDDEMWNGTMEGVAGNVFKCIREVLPYMEGKGGSIVNIASMYGVVSPNPSMYNDVCAPYFNPVDYGAGKASVIQMTKYLGAYLIGKNINVNCISPGTYPSPEIQKNTEFVRRLSEKNPAHRIGVPEDLKGAVLFLASEASRYVVGQNIQVDGGWTIW